MWWQMTPPLHWRGLPKLNPVITWSNPLTATLVLVKLLGDTCYCHHGMVHGFLFTTRACSVKSSTTHYSLQYIQSTLHCIAELYLWCFNKASAGPGQCPQCCILWGEERVTEHSTVQYSTVQCPQCCMLYIVRRGAGNRTPVLYVVCCILLGGSWSVSSVLYVVYC